MKDWLNYKPAVDKFQQGGEVPAGAGAGAQGEGAGAQGGAQGGSPEQQLQALLIEYSKSHDPQVAVQIAELLLQMFGASQQGQAPMARHGMKVTKAPVFKK